jgi:release factor glutamine methyltransferase
MTTIKDALEQGMRALMQRGNRDAREARLDVQVLLGYVMDVDRATFYAYPEREVPQELLVHYNELIVRRQQGEPVAYLTGHKAFYGLDFLVDRRVLIPRSETELLVEAALGAIRRKLAADRLPVVADIGTGSGVIPVTLAVEEPRLPYLYACDISSDALDVARLNCQRHQVEQRVRLLLGDLLAPLPEPLDVLMANLPYVGTDEMADMAGDVLDYEPHQALFSGPQGLDHLRRLCQQARQAEKLKEGAVMLLEIGYRQCEPLKCLLHELWPQATITCQKDYAGWDRLVEMRL